MTLTITQKSGHFAWCALVALHLAEQDGQVKSDIQKNLFLIRWLATYPGRHTATLFSAFTHPSRCLRRITPS
ncbi:hypothetical protein C2C86_20690 [Escherichia coli]|nr:hypothetical protein [Escherichia coli]EFO3600110.1 hypothetical protein [Escherichia coli]EFO3683867.1 hypothetical protein [Escherichia coli]